MHILYDACEHAWPIEISTVLDLPLCVQEIRKSKVEIALATVSQCRVLLTLRKLKRRL